MALISSAPSRVLIIYLGLFIYYLSCSSNAQIDETSLQIMMSNALDWSAATSVTSLEPEDGFDVDGEEQGGVGEDSDEVGFGRRSLFWARMHYYISYGALSANRIPCPPRSGRSYYSHNCYRARGPVHPYSRGCSSITRCRR